MHLTPEEALALIDDWKYKQVPLQVQLPGAPVGARTHAAVWTRSGTTVTLKSEDGKTIDVDLAGADFNGDGKTGSGSSQGAYLICEFGEHDQVAFRTLSPKPGG